MKKNLLFFFFFSAGIVLQAQTFLPLNDNMVINNNANLKILGGTYNITDAGNDGLIQINNVSDVIIDGDSVYTNGGNYSGYVIKINNASNIVIKNFSSAMHYNYGVYATNSHNIEIVNCNFSFNKVDSAGWIDVWSGYTNALGGGALFYNCDSIYVHDCIMHLQNDGVALYNCAHAQIDSNDFAWNTSYGIRMFYTDSSSIRYNLANHINRPFTDPSDCAALLMTVSNSNIVEHNDLGYSGDGVFLGQYQNSSTLSNNYFAYNQCSGSPHNAIEATFADGNVYRHNICDYSEYGMWLGYSFNSIVDSNEINYNQYAGIAVDRGFNNSITHNHFYGNPYGVDLWAGNPIAGYENQTSHDYTISNNTLLGNTLAVSAVLTENISMTNDSLIKNYAGVEFSQSSTNEHLNDNFFDASVTYDIMNLSTDAIDAANNTFVYCDAAYINDKIEDQNDVTSYGAVNIAPYNCSIANPVYETTLPSDLAEPPLVWYDYPETCGWLGAPVPLMITWDSILKHDGAASVHLNTGTGWYNDLSLRADSNKIAQWNVSNFSHFSFWLYSVNVNQSAFQFFHVRIGNKSGGYFSYTSSGSVLNQSLNQWKNYSVPLAGGSGWTKQTVGNVSLSDINYVEVWTDSYGVGYDLWLDGVQFTEPTSTELVANDVFSAELFPNPFSVQSILVYHTLHAGDVGIDIYDLQGRMIREVNQKNLAAGNHSLDIDGSIWVPGIYLYRIASGDECIIGKMEVE